MVVADQGPQFELASNDPLVGYLLSAAGAVDIRGLDLDSPALAELKAAGVVLTVPLISSGSLIGLVSLGPRLSERDYSIGGPPAAQRPGRIRGARHAGGPAGSAAGGRSA